jgi:hypothetical protein
VPAACGQFWPCLVPIILNFEGSILENLCLIMAATSDDLQVISFQKEKTTFK